MFSKLVRNALFGGSVIAAGFGLAAQPAAAQTYGLATMQPGTLANTVASAIAKTLKEKGGLNTLVQATAGESVLIPMDPALKKRHIENVVCPAVSESRIANSPDER